MCDILRKEEGLFAVVGGGCLQGDEKLRPSAQGLRHKGVRVVKESHDVVRKAFATIVLEFSSDFDALVPEGGLIVLVVASDQGDDIGFFHSSSQMRIV